MSIQELPGSGQATSQPLTPRNPFIQENCVLKTNEPSTKEGSHLMRESVELSSLVKQEAWIHLPKMEAPWLASQERSWRLAKLPRHQQSILVNRRSRLWSFDHGASPAMNDNVVNAVPSLSHHTAEEEKLEPNPWSCQGRNFWCLPPLPLIANTEPAGQAAATIRPPWLTLLCILCT